MEKSKLSEEIVIKLGKKIVEELQLESSLNTLGIWMSHYLAELIQKSENCDSKDEEIAIKRECYDVILKLWQNVEHLPNVTKPLSELEPLIEMLDALKKDNYISPFWRNISDNYKNPTWKEWITLLKEKSENIFELSLYTTINTDLLNKKKGWMSDYKTLLSDEELKMFEHLEDLVNRSKSFISFNDDKEEILNLDKLSPQEKLENIFNRIETELHEVGTKFDELKKTLLSEIKYENQ